MKVLYIARHAKSDWGNPALDDFDRPLNKRGKRDALLMGKYLHQQKICPEVMISSPAKRAQKTAGKLAKEMGFSLKKLLLEPNLYLADTDSVLTIIRQTPDTAASLMVVGHNPGLTESANLLSDAQIENIPTCGIVTIQFDIKQWSDISPGAGRCLAFNFPKQFLNEDK